MERRVKEREDPFVFVPGSQSLICVALNCYSSEPTPFPIAQYARNVDYHLLFREKLAALVKSIKDILPECLPITCCDTSPVQERAYAERAGIGWIGKSSQLISRNFGTWLLLGEVLINQELITDQPHPNMCGRCDLCMRACPTGAIEQEYVVDCRRCLSYYTIEHRGSLPEAITAPCEGTCSAATIASRLAPSTSSHAKQLNRGSRPATTYRHSLDCRRWMNRPSSNSFVKPRSCEPGWPA